MASSARVERLVRGLCRFRSMFAICISLVAALAATPAGAVDVAGVTAVTFGWTAASGPVGSYRVFVARNTSTFPATPDFVVGAAARKVTVPGAVGDRIKVRVSAVSTAGLVGPYSPSSVEVRFVAGDASPALPGDLDGDGRADLILYAAADGELSTRSISTSKVRAIWSPPAAEGASLVDAGDYDADGLADLLWRTRDGQLRLCLNDGVAADDCRTIGIVGPEYMVFPAGDVNGDGRRDILFQGLNRPVLLCLGAPTALTTCANLPASLPDTFLVEAGDTNADGTGDLLRWSIGTGAIETCTISNMALSGCRTTVTIPLGWAVYAVDDLNGDGRADLIFRDSSADSTAMLLCPRSGTGLLCDEYVGPVSTWAYLGSGDYDGDGDPDLVFRDHATGNVSIRLLDGTQPEGWPIVLLTPAASQLHVF